MRTFPVATGVDFQDDSAVSCDLNIGDPVRLSNGNLIVCAGGTADVYGIIARIQVLVGLEGKRRPFHRVPNQVAYGTDLTKQTLVTVIPAVGQLFAINGSAAVASQAAALADVGENADHILTATADSDGNNTLNPQLVIGSASTSTQQWRIEGVSRSADSQDFDATGLEWIVTVNETGQAPHDTTGT
jgi:hypothetical protein